MCWPLAETENFRRTREKPLVPRVGKRSPRLRILEISGGRETIKNPLEQKILRGGGGCKSKSLPWRGIDILISGTTHQQNRVFIRHCSRDIVFSQCRNCFQRYTIICNQFSRDNGTTDGSCKH